MRGSKLTACLAMAVSLSLAVTACGGSTSSSSGGSSSGASAGGSSESGWTATNSLQGKGEIAVFLPGGGIQYNTKYAEGATDYLKQYGYTVKVFENTYDQNEQDSQVQQYLATGAKPAGFILYPPVPEAAKNSARQLQRVAPTVWGMTPPTQAPSPFAGPDSTTNGNLMGESFVQLRKKLEADGVKLPNDGAVLVYNAPESLATGQIRLAGFTDAATKGGYPPNIIGAENGMVDRDSGYKLANQTLSKYGDKFDIVWALNLTGAAGVAQALKEAGRVPGKDVWIVSAGDCGGGLGEIKNGDVYSTIAESGTISGIVGARTLLQLIATGKTQPGSDAPEATADMPELTATSPFENVGTPLETVTLDNVDSVKIWGEGADVLCPS